MKLRKLIVLGMLGLSLVSLTACDGANNDSKENSSSATEVSTENLSKKYESAGIGDIIEFGLYEQDNNDENGYEAIEWIVLDKEDNRILVLSKYCLDVEPYYYANKDVTWETSTIRQWLNENFLERAFSVNEADIIMEAELKNLDNEMGYYDEGKGGNDTKDKVFLLSIEEAKKYFSSDSDRIAEATEYAKEQGASTNFSDSDSEIPRWWLRSPGSDADLASNVREDGSIAKSGLRVDYEGYCVRPALWINIQ